ncbi:MAG: hypothetical protein LC770_04405, partial [Acidobacteria bacterium]|nr:hypothetical protein [Acidobacteriota bacterium]
EVVCENHRARHVLVAPYPHLATITKGDRSTAKSRIDTGKQVSEKDESGAPAATRDKRAERERGTTWNEAFGYFVEQNRAACAALACLQQSA